VKLLSALSKAPAKSAPPSSPTTEDFSQNRPTIVEAIESKRFFKPLFQDISSWQSWLVFLKALYGLPMVEEEQELFKSCTQRDYTGGKSFEEAYAVCGRRGGKSRIAAVIAAFEAIFGGWEEKLAKGERGWIFCIATDRDQAKIVLDYTRSIFRMFPDLIKREVSQEIELNNQIVVAVKTCNFRAPRGFSTAVIVCDELAFWRSEESSNPAQEVIISLLPSLMDGAKLIGLTTPYGRFGYVYDIWKENFARTESDILVWQAGTRVMNPTYSEKKIQKLISRDRTKFTAEYQAIFRADIEAFLPQEMIRSAMTHGPLPPELGKNYVAFIDPSGGRSDSMTLAVAFNESGKIHLARTEECRPPFNPGEVVEAFCIILKAYGIREVTSDRYGGVWVESAFSKHGIRVKMSDLSASDLYLEFQPLLAMGRVELIDDDRLCLQFQTLERQTRSGGKDLVTHYPGGHDDLSNAVAGACVFASRERVWTEAEQEAHLPTAIKNENAERLLCDIRGEDYTDKKRREDAAEEMDAWMTGQGMSRIIKR